MRKITVATISTGTIASTSSPSRTLITSIAMSTPKNVSSELIIVTSPVCRNDDSASRSDVMRVMIRPDSSRS
jgi:hypothetical protein